MRPHHPVEMEGNPQSYKTIIPLAGHCSPEAGVTASSLNMIFSITNSNLSCSI
jgi:hypothetical protein